MSTGFIRVAAVTPKVNVADCKFNAEQIINQCNSLCDEKVSVAVFPRLSLTGCTCGDLFRSQSLHNGVKDAICAIAEASAQWDMLVFVGAPLSDGGRLYDCAVAISCGRVLGAVPKCVIARDQYRWWTSGYDVDSLITCGNHIFPLNSRLLFKAGDAVIAAEIDDDLLAPLAPSTFAAIAGANVVVNLAAEVSNATNGEDIDCRIKSVSAAQKTAIVYASAGYGESSTDYVFSGKKVIAECGQIVEEDFDSDVRDIDLDLIAYERSVMAYDLPQIEADYQIICSDVNVGDNAELARFIPVNPYVADGLKSGNVCYTALNIQTEGLMRRLEAARCRSLVIGISGGLDSTLALIVAVHAFDRLGYDRKGIVAITMPGFGTSNRTHSNALELMQRLDVTIREIPIADAVKQHFNDINHDINVHDVTYENSQARERTQILMDVANQVNGMVLGTGDLSELALGWATYNGDHMSMYGVNAGVPKTMVRLITDYVANIGEQFDAEIASILRDIIDTPVSPELIPTDDNGDIAQKTEDLVGPYELHDFVLYYVLRYGFSPRKIYLMAQNAFEGIYDDDVIKYWMKVFFRRFFTQQFKRSCMPDGPQVFGIGLSPRGAWAMPSDATVALWLDECECL
jgi:NAD+ synthase (glutamine-hydrolysing)